MKLDFFSDLFLDSWLPCTLRYIHEYVCKLLGNFILSACFVASLGIILLAILVASTSVW